MKKTQSTRRNFLLVAGATGAAAVAATIGAQRALQPAGGARQQEGGQRSGYQLTEHIRNYYRTTLV